MALIYSLKLSRGPITGFATLGLYWGSFAALAPEMKAQIGASDALYGTVLLGMSLGLIATAWVAPLFDRALGARALWIAAALLALAFLIPGQATTPLALFSVLVFMGLFSGIKDVVMNARVAELEVHHTHPLMNANHGTFSLFYAIGAMVTGLGRELALSPAMIFSGFAIVGLLSLPFMGRPVATPVSDATPTGGLPTLLIALCGGVVLVAYTSEASVEVWSAIHIEQTLGGGAAQGAAGPAVLGLTMAVGRYWGQVLTARFSELRMINIAATLALLGALGVALASTPTLAYLGFGLLGLGVSIIGPLGLAITGRVSPPERRTAALARVSVAGFLGYLIAPVGIGFIAEATSLRIGFVAVAVLLLMAPLLTHALKARTGL